jgi:CubicO group peptidase (beta-lactamase class C family)
VESIRPWVTSAAAKDGLAGVAAAVVRPGTEPSIVCWGVADTVSQQPVGPLTVFRIGSVTKTMTAIGLMQLHEAGRFGLDDPVNEHLRGFTIVPRPGWPDVTFRHLLTHTSGIGEIPRLSDVVRPPAFGLDKPGSRGVDLAALYRGAIRPEVPAGTKWAYANHGFAIAGQLVQDISGIPLPEYMRKRVFDPLGMISTDYLRTDRVMRGAVATGHRTKKDRPRPVRDYDRSLLGPGAVRSTLSDMTTYAQALLRTDAGEEESILGQSTLAEMWSPHFSPDPRIPGMGLAFFLHDVEGHRVIGHDGNLPGFASALLLSPEDQVGVVALTNTATLFGAHLLAEAILRSELALPAATSGLPPEVPERVETWDELVGYYAPDRGLLTNVRPWSLVGGEVQVLTIDDHLVARALSPSRQVRRGTRLRPVDRDDPTRFELNAGGMVVPVVFRRDPDGQVMCLGHPMLSTLRGRPWWRSSRVRLEALIVAVVAAIALRSRHRRSD